MLDRIATVRTAPVAQLLRCAALCVPLCAGLAGCASSTIEGPLVFADAGKYRYHNCDQLAAASKKQLERQRELKELIDKAEQGAGGQIVSVLAYRADYVAVNEDLQVIDSTTREKNCVTTSRSTGAIR